MLTKKTTYKLYMTEQNCERYTDIFTFHTKKTPGPCVTLLLVLGISCDNQIRDCEILNLIFDLREFLCMHYSFLELVVVKSNHCTTYCSKSKCG